MVTLFELWLPILVSAVFVFIASSIIHMALPIHKNDYDKLPDEDRLLSAMRDAKVGRGDYFFPFACHKDLNSEETKKKFSLGPVGFITVRPNGPPAMGKALVQWFLLTIFMGVLVGYVTGVTCGPGTDYLRIFRISGAVAFIGYVASVPSESIWKGTKWSSTFKMMFDGAIYALVTAGVFGWLWPS
ncbi:MAG: hypothetical protein IFK94_07600 [Acidobacteria bacterium]|uniref:Uncharacterized protein n=1 Tax=Candidatus Polarisedimenticola svalbardensis TaxID=2886004 RepID=A0A8J6XSS6_9BACT|nr:hypothetical protein [Candidatus Polarisedimenticola svalbardensis]